MNIGTTNTTYRRYPLEARYTKMREHGYTMCDFQLANTDDEVYSMNDAELRAYMKVQRDAAESQGIGFSQLHGPWRWPPRDLTPEDRGERLEKMRRCLFMTSLVGCPYMVIHPIMPYGTNDIGSGNEQATWDLNVEFMSALLETAHEYDVSIAIENMPMPNFSMASPEMMLKFVETLGDECMQVCLDTGHSVICGVQPGDAVRMLGGRLKVLHVHDNNGRSDEHHPPYVCNSIDWEDFGRALREVGFDGTFSYEFDGIAKFRDDVFEDACRMYVKLAKSIIEAE